MTFTESAVNMSSKSEIIAINHEIKRNGYRITLVMQDICPRFIYTIGLKEKFGYDLIMPGCSEFDAENSIFTVKKFIELNFPDRISLNFTRVGNFYLQPSDPSWIELMALGALDFYGGVTPFMQIRPDESNLTIDTPDLSKAWSLIAEPVWQWLKVPWQHPVPSMSTATTNLAALRGSRVTEAARWAEDEWELFSGSGPDTPEEDIRVMPLATLLGFDPSISEVVNLGVGQAAWRNEDELSWNDWKPAS